MKDLEKLSFENTKTAFQILDDKELKKAKRLFKMVASRFLLKMGKIFLPLALATRLPVSWAVKGIYNYFVAGETIKSADRLAQKLSIYNVKSIPDYSVEGKGSEESFLNVKNELLYAIELIAASKDMPFAVFKPSGMAPFSVLEKVSAGIELNTEEETSYEGIREKWDVVFAAGAAKNVPVLVDAEESWIQKALDDLLMEFSLKYNTETPIVWNTFQMYRHDRLELLRKQIEFAREKGIKLGYKFVRGAYWEKENKYAAGKGIISAVYQKKEETDAAYDEAMKICFENRDIVHFMNASHNEESNYYLAEMMLSHKIDTADPGIWFAQLLGMSNHITFNLAEQCFNVAKYVPYAPLRKVMPYLLRRAEENSSMRGQTGRELALIEKEMDRRKTI
ncbi:MAG: proline dehydrogenase [Marinilabiliales bacterium]|nr:MAG: proline dehydrogenase [Marinilabiliales bacterium]